MRRKTQYSASELIDCGFVRENWSIEELNAKGFGTKGVITSFDSNAIRAEKELSVDAPFAEGIQKWQLPIPLPGFRVIMTDSPQIQL